MPDLEHKYIQYVFETESLHDGGYGKPEYKSAISCSATGDDFVLLHALGFLYL